MNHMLNEILRALTLHKVVFFMNSLNFGVCNFLVYFLVTRQSHGQLRLRNNCFLIRLIFQFLINLYFDLRDVKKLFSRFITACDSLLKRLSGFFNDCLTTLINLGIAILFVFGLNLSHPILDWIRRWIRTTVSYQGALGHILLHQGQTKVSILIHHFNYLF